MVALPLAIQLANVELAHQRPVLFILVPPAADGQRIQLTSACRIARGAAHASRIEVNCRRYLLPLIDDSRTFSNVSL